MKNQEPNSERTVFLKAIINLIEVVEAEDPVREKDMECLIEMDLDSDSTKQDIVDMPVGELAVDIRSGTKKTIKLLM